MSSYTGTERVYNCDTGNKNSSVPSGTSDKNDIHSRGRFDPSNSHPGSIPDLDGCKNSFFSLFHKTNLILYLEFYIWNENNLDSSGLSQGGGILTLSFVFSILISNLFSFVLLDV